MFILLETSYGFLHISAAPSRAAYPRRWPSLASPAGSEPTAGVESPGSPMRKAAGECGTTPREGSLSGVLFLLAHVLEQAVDFVVAGGFDPTVFELPHPPDPNSGVVLDLAQPATLGGLFNQPCAYFVYCVHAGSLGLNSLGVKNTIPQPEGILR